MGNNFTVVQSERQHFGDQPGSFNDIEPDVPFVGPTKDFKFNCPDVDPRETAVLLFQSRDVNHSRHVFQVNGVQIAGGLPVSPSRDTWNGNVLLVEAQHRLQEKGNVLHVESRNPRGAPIGDIDDFIIDNVVIQYKTREASPRGIFDVRSFGATGDGQTDDLDAILAAREALNAEGGGVLFFPRGTFVVRDTIELGASTTVAGLGACTVLLAKPDASCFNMLLVRNSDNVRVRDLVLDGNRANTRRPAEADELNVGCGFLGLPVNEGQTGLSITNVIVRNHHGSGIRISGPHNSKDPYQLNANEVEVIGCQIAGCAGRGVMLSRVTRARIAGNVVTSCTQAGIQLALSRSAVIDGNVIQKTIQREGTNAGHGISAANSFDYVIVNNLTSENDRWGIVASGGIGLSPEEGYAMSQRYVVANNVCRANAAGGITIDPSTVDADGKPTGFIHDSFATVAANVCAANKSHGIHTIHAGYVAVQGNICDRNDNAGISIVASRCAVVADNVLIANKYGVAFFGNPEEVAENSLEMGHHLLGGNVYDDPDENQDPADNQKEIRFGEFHPAIRQLHDRWPSGDVGGLNLPVKPTPGDAAKPVEGVLYLNPADRRLTVYADGTWRNLQVTSGTSW